MSRGAASQANLNESARLRTAACSESQTLAVSGGSKHDDAGDCASVNGERTNPSVHDDLLAHLEVLADALATPSRHSTPYDLIPLADRDELRRRLER